jgi:plasmid stabilization system protein ParE
VMHTFKRPQFLLDLADQLTWLKEQAGPHVANLWYDALQDTIEQLQQHPLLGRERLDLKPKGIRSWRLSRFPRWIVFYQAREDALVLLRVIPGMMNLPSLKLES